MHPLIYKQLRDDIRVINSFKQLIDFSSVEVEKLPADEETLSHFAQVFAGDSSKQSCFMTCFRGAQQMDFLISYLQHQMRSVINLYQYTDAVQRELDRLDVDILDPYLLDSSDLDYRKHLLKKSLDAMKTQYKEFNELLSETRYEHIVENYHDPSDHECQPFVKETKDALKEISSQLAFLSFTFRDFLDILVMKAPALLN